MCRKTLKNKINGEEKDERLIEGIVARMSWNEFFLLMEFSRAIDQNVFKMMLISLSQDKEFRERKDEKSLA